MEGNLLYDVGRRRERGDSGPLFMPESSTAEFIVRALRIAQRVATHDSHVAVRFSPSLDFTHSQRQYQARFALSCHRYPNVRPQSALRAPRTISTRLGPYHKVKGKSCLDPLRMQTAKPQEMLRPHSAPSQSLSPLLAASQVPLSRTLACTAVSGTSRHECLGRRGCERCLFL